jgi:hypothetical protein
VRLEKQSGVFETGRALTKPNYSEIDREVPPPFFEQATPGECGASNATTAKEPGVRSMCSVRSLPRVHLTEII